MNKNLGLAYFDGPARRPLRVTMLGIRGFPNVQGGAEKHVEKLSCALAEAGCRVEAIVRSNCMANRAETWRGVRFMRLWAPRVTGLEAFVHSFLGVLRAAASRPRPDILHIHAIGPACFTPLARVLGLRVVVTHHVLNYENEKWGSVARWILRFGEWAGMAFANGRIAVSDSLARQMDQTYRMPVRAIPNGVDPPQVVGSTETLRAFGLAPRRYALMVARIDRQKRPLDLIAAYARLREPRWKLALVGGADYSGSYAREVAAAASATPGVVLLGHQSGPALAELYCHAGIFVLASSHEGQPIAVLEAASYGLGFILSDIPAHREIALPGVRYVGVGDVAALAEQFETVFAAEAVETSDDVERDRLMAKHDWRAIAEHTLTVYFDALSGAKRADFAADPVAANTRELS
jgi:glycosyltransferase involved in cell wall biosynthesis